MPVSYTHLDVYKRQVLHVTDVHETNGIIWHTVDALPETAQPGAAVTGTIDWEWRFDKMQPVSYTHLDVYKRQPRCSSPSSVLRRSSSPASQAT